MAIQSDSDSHPDIAPLSESAVLYSTIDSKVATECPKRVVRARLQ